MKEKKDCGDQEDNSFNDNDDREDDKQEQPNELETQDMQQKRTL